MPSPRDPRSAGVSLRPTSPADLPDLLALWNDGEVMRWVGYPDGLGYDEAAVAAWWRAMSADPDCRHFVILDGEGRFCGEVYYGVDHLHRRAALDIKLRSSAQGRGIATVALGSLIVLVFANEPRVDAVWTEPAQANRSARRLYERCGLAARPRPHDLPGDGAYWERRRGGAGEGDGAEGREGGGRHQSR